MLGRCWQSDTSPRSARNSAAERAGAKVGGERKPEPRKATPKTTR
jgi:hypothetical protein